MPRFHFHLDGDPDEHGIELQDVATAKCEAVQYAGRHICDQADRFWDKAEWTLTVTDEKGLTLFQLHIIGTETAAIRSVTQRSAEEIATAHRGSQPIDA